MPWPKADADHLIVSSLQMKDIERQLFSFGMPVEALMEKVGLEIKNWFLEKPELLKNGVIVLVGPGHNGGDGLVLARELFLSGFDVDIWCPFPVKKSLTAKHLSYCKSIGIKQLHTTPDPSSKGLWIEAIFGLGQTRPIPKEIGSLFDRRDNQNPGKLISLDVPAGMCSDSGKQLQNSCLKASFTLSIGLYKSGLLQDIALPYIGNLERIDIGIPEIVLEHFSGKIPLMISSKDIESAEFPSTEVNASKYQRGRVLFVGGDYKYKGASLLTLQGAVASGIGSIQAILPRNIIDILWTNVPEVVFHEHDKNKDNQLINISDSLSKINLNRIDSLVIGPGLGLEGEKWEDFSSSLEHFQGLLILDADALNRLSFSKESWEWFAKRKGPTWITPHINEFGRLFPHLDSSFPLEASALAAKNCGIHVLLKGAHSVISSPDGSTRQIFGTSCLAARSGLGDLLAGFVGGIGGLGISSKKDVDGKLFALAVLIHAHASRTCKKGSNATSISKTLGKFVKSIQRQNVRYDTKLGAK